MACNLMYDDRVSPEREAEFLAVFARPRPKDEKKGKRQGRLQWALRTYRDERVNGTVQEFLEPALNGRNIVPTLKAPALVRVIDLSGLSKIFSNAREQLVGGAVFDKFPHQKKLTSAGSKRLETERGNWLDQVIGQHGEEAVARAVLEAIASQREFKKEEGKRHAFFAAKWYQVERIVKRPGLLAAALGVPSRGCRPRWLMVLRYSADSGVTLVRPTVLDAGVSPCHFPSPGAEPARRGGHPVDLRGKIPRALRSEYLHVEVDHSIEQWFEAGSLLKRVDGPMGEELGRSRMAHHRLVRQRYRQRHPRWMPHCF